MGRALRTTVRYFPAASVLFLFCLLAAGSLRSVERFSWLQGGAVVGLALGLSLSAWSRLRRGRREGPRSMWEDLELGGGLIAAAYTLVSLGGPSLFPGVYLVLAFLVACFPRASALTLLGVAVVFDALFTLSPPQPDLTAFCTHAAFLFLFAALHQVLLSGRLALARKAAEDAVRERIREVEEHARTFRLVNAGTQDSFQGLKEQEKWLVASVSEIDGAVGSALEIAETVLQTHTCAAFLLSSDDKTLKLYDCRSSSERVLREKFPSGEGTLGGVIKRLIPLRMHAPPAMASGLKGVTYYDGPLAIGALLAVPIVEGSGLVRGVLVADRLTHEPFTEADERLLTTLTSAVLRAIEVERVMTYIRKTRDEKDRFFRAIEELNRAGAPEQVFLAVLEATRQLSGLDFCAVTLVSERDGKRYHRIARMSGVTAPGKTLEGREFLDNQGLVANVVRYGTPLPGRDLKAMDRQVIFDDETQVRGLASLKIFPLNAGDRILGTLVAGSRKRSVLGDDRLRMIEVIAIQAAQAVLRAQLFEQMERMATTDGLTGLLNHRTFQARADDALAQAKRYGRRCSVILTDIDHFKSVNDTYGHPTGDQVLKGVARILRDKARDTDVVARYGGEEFAIIMPETDAKGAQVIAERIREAIQAEVFQTEVGPLKVTLSLGIATTPDHGTEKQVLVDLADQCLYHAKRHGRNQSVTVQQMQEGGRRAPKTA